MNTPQRNDACVLTVSRETADVLRLQSLRVMEFNHEYFEDILDFTPAGQRALGQVYRDALDVLDVVGWDPDAGRDVERFDVPLTFGHIEQLQRRRHDLGATNVDRLDGVPNGDPINPEVLAEIITDRLAAQILDRLVADYLRMSRG